MGQQAQTQLSAPKKLDSLLQKKIALDRLNAAKRQYTIQVFYGSFEATTAELEKVKRRFRSAFVLKP